MHFIIDDPQKTTRKDDPQKTQKDRGELSQTEDSGRKGERKAGIRKDAHITILNQRLGPKANQPDPNHPPYMIPLRAFPKTLATKELGLMQMVVSSKLPRRTTKPMTTGDC